MFIGPRVDLLVAGGNLVVSAVGSEITRRRLVGPGETSLVDAHAAARRQRRPGPSPADAGREPRSSRWGRARRRSCAAAASGTPRLGAELALIAASSGPVRPAGMTPAAPSPRAGLCGCASPCAWRTRPTGRRARRSGRFARLRSGRGTRPRPRRPHGRCGRLDGRCCWRGRRSHHGGDRDSLGIGQGADPVGGVRRLRPGAESAEKQSRSPGGGQDHDLRDVLVDREDGRAKKMCRHPEEAVPSTPGLQAVGGLFNSAISDMPKSPSFWAVGAYHVHVSAGATIRTRADAGR